MRPEGRRSTRLGRPLPILAVVLAPEGRRIVAPDEIRGGQGCNPENAARGSRDHDSGEIPGPQHPRISSGATIRRPWYVSVASWWRGRPVAPRVPNPSRSMDHPAAVSG